MHTTIEEETVLLYTLYVCGKRLSKARATHFILSNGLMKKREGDEEIVSTGETRMENRIAWTRENLKEKEQLSMPKHGIWAIIQKGVERIEAVAVRSLDWDKPRDGLPALLLEIRWARFSDEFLKRLQELGRQVKQRKESEGQQSMARNAASA